MTFEGICITSFMVLIITMVIHEFVFVLPKRYKKQRELMEKLNKGEQE